MPCFHLAAVADRLSDHQLPLLCKRESAQQHGSMLGLASIMSELETPASRQRLANSVCRQPTVCRSMSLLTKVIIHQILESIGKIPQTAITGPASTALLTAICQLLALILVTQRPAPDGKDPLWQPFVGLAMKKPDPACHVAAAGVLRVASEAGDFTPELKR